MQLLLKINKASNDGPSVNITFIKDIVRFFFEADTTLLCHFFMYKEPKANIYIYYKEIMY
jgi:hypothetical protein